MKHCQKCNLDFPDSFRFCGSCGGALSNSLSCQGCGELVEAKWTFCTNCGKSLSLESPNDQATSYNTPEQADLAAAPLTHSLTPRTTAPPTLTMPSAEVLTADTSERVEEVISREWYTAPELFDERDETTATPIARNDLVPRTVAVSTAQPQSGNGKSPPTLTMLAAYGESRSSVPPEEARPQQRLLVGLLLLVVFGLIGFVGFYWWTHRGSIAQPPSQADSSSAPAAADSSASASLTAPKKAERITSIGGAEEEWKRLRERRIGAKPSDTKAVIAAFEDAEKKYPSDYRFPYDRAKLSIKGITTHHEAFGALSAAAEKAIDNGKAQEMLDSLMADKDGDFYKLSRGHHEWQVLEDALRNKDRSGLKMLYH